MSRVCVCLGQLMPLTSFRQSVRTLKTDLLACIQMLQPLQQTSSRPMCVFHFS